MLRQTKRCRLNGDRPRRERLSIRLVRKSRGQDIRSSAGAIRPSAGLAVNGSKSGCDWPVEILFGVVRRCQEQEALDLVRAVDEKAFVVLEPVQHAAGGYVPRFIVPGVAVRH